MFTIFTAAAMAVPLMSTPVIGGGDDGNRSIEAEILKTLLDNGAITEKQYHDLIAKAEKLRRERADTHEELDRELKRLSEAVDERLKVSQDKKEEPTVNVSFKNGLYFKSADGNYSLHPWIVLRERFTYDDIGNVKGIANEDTGSFEGRTARLWFDGHAVTPDLTYLLMVDFASSTNLLRDSWIDYRFDDALHIRFGQQKRPIDYEGFTYAPKTGFVDKAPVVAFFQRNPGEDFEAGLKAWGRFDNQLEWHLGVFNGDGPQNGGLAGVSTGPGAGGLFPAGSSNNDSNGLEVVGRLMWTPMGPMDNAYFTNNYVEGDYGMSKDARMAFGTHYSYNPERNNGAAVPLEIEQRIQTWGADAVLAYQGVFALAEVFVRTIDRDNKQGLPNTTDNGYFAQLQYFLGSETANRGFELLGRWSVIDVDAATLGFVPVNGVTEVHDATAGVNYLFNGHRLKIQTAYTWRENIRRAGENTFDNILQVQMQLIF